MQDDDAANPGMLWVLDGEALWRRPEGPDRKSCADCHGDAGISMSGVAARYPAYDAARSAARSTSNSASMPAGRNTSVRRRCRMKATTCWR